jgi:hypothetical protein
LLMITPAIRTLFCSHKTRFNSNSSKAFPRPPLALKRRLMVGGALLVKSSTQISL